MDYKTGIRKHSKEGTSKRKRCRCILQKEKYIEVNIGERIYQDEENIHENEATQVDTESLGEEEKTKIQDILDLMKDNCRIYLRGFNKIDRSLLAKLSRKKNCTLKYIRIENIADANILIKAVIVCVGKNIGLKACGGKNKKESKHWWKKRIKRLINKVRKHINILRGEIRREEQHKELERKYNIKKGIRTVAEELKQWLHAKTVKLKKYEKRLNQYRINRMFAQN